MPLTSSVSVGRFRSSRAPDQSEYTLIPPRTVQRTRTTSYIKIASNVSVVSPNTKLVVHQYDYPRLMGADGSFLGLRYGPWFRPPICDKSDQAATKEHAFKIVKYVLRRLADQLEELPNNLFVVAPT